MEDLNQNYLLHSNIKWLITAEHKLCRSRGVKLAQRNRMGQEPAGIWHGNDDNLTEPFTQPPRLLWGEAPHVSRGFLLCESSARNPVYLPRTLVLFELSDNKHQISAFFLAGMEQLRRCQLLPSLPPSLSQTSTSARCCPTCAGTGSASTASAPSAATAGWATPRTSRARPARVSRAPRTPSPSPPRFLSPPATRFSLGDPPSSPGDVALGTPSCFVLLCASKS